MKIRKRSCSLCVHQNEALLVRLKDPVSHRSYLFPPGGQIEPSETSLAAAERETLEETGYEIVALPDSESVVDYTFYWAGRDHQCRTHFFLAQLKDPSTKPKPVNDEAFNLGPEWVSIGDLPSTLSFHADIRSAVMDLLQKA